MSLLKESIFPIHLEANKCLFYALTNRDKRQNPAAILLSAEAIQMEGIEEHERAYRFVCTVGPFSGRFYVTAAIDQRNKLWSRILEARISWHSPFVLDESTQWKIKDGVSLWSGGVLFELTRLPNQVKWESYPLLPKPEHVAALAAMKEDAEATLLMVNLDSSFVIGKLDKVPEDTHLVVHELTKENGRTYYSEWSFSSIAAEFLSKLQLTPSGEDLEIVWTEAKVGDVKQPLSEVTLFTGGQAIPVYYPSFKNSFKFFETSFNKSLVKPSE